MQDNQDRKNPRRVVFISCMAIVAILIVLLVEGTRGQKPQNKPDTIVKVEAPKKNSGYIQLIHLLEKQLAASDIAAEDRTSIELERQIEDLQDMLSSRDEDRTSYEEKINELTDELNKVKNQYSSLNKIKQPIIELKAQLKKAEKSLVKKDDILEANLQIEEEKKQKLRDKITKLEKDRDLIDKYKNENRKLLAALEENAETIEGFKNKLEHNTVMLQTNLALEEKTKQGLRDEIASLRKNSQQSKTQTESLQNEIHDKNEIIKTLIAFEEKYKEEKKKRLIKEQVVKQLQAHLNDQRQSLESMEKTRQTLTSELKKTENTYAELMGELSSHKQAPSFSNEIFVIEPQTHIVEKGETLMKISEKYYGTARKWKRILEANHNAISDQNKIQPGTLLTIP